MIVMVHLQKNQYANASPFRVSQFPQRLAKSSPHVRGECRKISYQTEKGPEEKCAHQHRRHADTDGGVRGLLDARDVDEAGSACLIDLRCSIPVVRADQR